MKQLYISALKAGFLISSLDIAVLVFLYQGNHITLVQNIVLLFLDLIIFQMVVYPHGFSFKKLFLCAIITLNISNTNHFFAHLALHHSIDTAYKTELANKATQKSIQRAKERSQQRGVNYQLSNADLGKTHAQTKESFEIVGLLKTWFLSFLISFLLASLYALCGLIPYDGSGQH
jgi:hypothetical protein